MCTSTGVVIFQDGLIFVSHRGVFVWVHHTRLRKVDDPQAKWEETEKAN